MAMSATAGLSQVGGFVSLVGDTFRAMFRRPFPLQEWLGRLNLPVALATRKIKVAGGVAGLMGLVPALAPAYDKYKAYLGMLGRSAEV